MSEIELNYRFLAKTVEKLSPSGATSRLPVREAAGRVKYALTEQRDWLRAEETDVGGPSGVADWLAVWSDDSETAGF